MLFKSRPRGYTLILALLLSLLGSLIVSALLTQTLLQRRMIHNLTLSLQSPAQAD